jgi:hypothetical protein
MSLSVIPKTGNLIICRFMEEGNFMAFYPQTQFVLLSKVAIL